jgi:hypothetical protein
LAHLKEWSCLKWGLDSVPSPGHAGFGANHTQMLSGLSSVPSSALGLGNQPSPR